MDLYWDSGASINVCIYFFSTCRFCLVPPSSHPNACQSHFGSPDKLPACWHAPWKPNKLTPICKQHEPSYLATVLTPAWIKHRAARASPNPSTPSSFMLTSLYSKGFFSSWSNFLVSGVWREHGLASKQDCEMHNRLWYTSELVMPICVLQEMGEEEALWRQGRWELTEVSVIFC